MRVGVVGGRRLHRQVGENLQQVVLDHVADRAGLFVEGPAALDAELLGHRDLHVLDVVRGSRSARGRCWRSGRSRMLWTGCFPGNGRCGRSTSRRRSAEDAVELLRRRKVAAERLLHDHPRAVGCSPTRPGAARPRRRAWAGWPDSAPADCADPSSLRELEGRRVVVVAVDVAEPVAQLGERLLVEPAVCFEAVACPGLERVELPARLGHADDRHVEVAMLGPSPGSPGRSSCAPGRRSRRRTPRRRPSWAGHRRSLPGLRMAARLQGGCNPPGAGIGGFHPLYESALLLQVAAEGNRMAESNRSAKSALAARAEPLEQRRA